MTNENQNENATQKKPNVVTLIVAIIIAVTLLFYFFTFQVRITEKAVITTFGKPTKIIDPSKDSSPGLYWKWPYPFQNVDIFDARMRIFTGTLEQIFTSDGKSIILQTYTGWQVDDPGTFQIRTGNEWEARTHLESSIRAHTYNVIAKYSFYEIIATSKGKSFLENIEESIRQRVNKDAINFGFIVGEFGFRRLVLPESTTKEVANRMKEERNRLAEKYRSEGVKESKIRRSEADAYREEKIIEAKAQAKEIEGEAFAEIADEYKIFAKDKKLALWLRKLESLRNILKANRSTLLLDPSTQPFDLLRNSSIDNILKEYNATKEANTSQKVTPENAAKETSNANDNENDTSSTNDTSGATIDKNSPAEIKSDREVSDEKVNSNSSSTDDSQNNQTNTNETNEVNTPQKPQDNTQETEESK